MEPAAADADRARRVDAAALAHVTARLLRSRKVPWLHEEAARRLGERLPLIKLQPARVLDWSGPLGASGELLRKSYPGARVRTIRQAGEPADEPALRWRWFTRRDHAVDAASIEPSSTELVWSNMALHGCLHPREQFESWHRALAVGGFLMFSTLGPGSLAELRELYRTHGWGPPMAELVDMHDVGDQLLAAGFADPVMDQETLTLSWSDAAALLSELRGWGGNVSPERHAGCRTPRWRRRLLAALDERSQSRRPALSVELVYGHAFRVAAAPAASARTEVPLEHMRALLQRPRGPLR